MTSSISIRKCDQLSEFHRCVEIQRAVWGESDLETEPYVTFVVAHQTGGQVIGAFDGDLMVGFTMSLVGYRNNTVYLHSHMTGVLSPHRDRGVGRKLKLFQREEALTRGIRLVEWTFDPLETRNAHFNFNRLGAIARQLIPNFYGITTSPLHRGLPTDRLLVEWHLDSKRVIAAINDLLPDPMECPTTVHLPNRVAQGESASPVGFSADQALHQQESPDTFSVDRALHERKSSGAPPLVLKGGSWVSPSLAEVQSRIRAEFQHWFVKGYAATAVRFTPTGADYCLVPWSDF
jgi:predicted GNAT superfamily acetyltransferase